MSNNKKRLIAAIMATVSGASSMAIGAAMFAHDKAFTRVERPDYALTAGVYCYERIADELPRKEFFFNAGKKSLKGYYYESKAQKGLVVVVHGFKSGSDDYLPITQYLVEHGYNVFSYDCTGTYESEGENMGGMCQSLVDLDNTIAYLQSNAVYKNQPLFLLGHSWGGYAAASVLALKSGIRGCATIAAMYSGSSIMMEKAQQYAGDFATSTKPILDSYQRLIFGDYVEYNSVRGINSVNIPVVVAHGVTDKTITFDKQSIICHAAEITNPNVLYYIGKGLQGSHTGIWHSTDSLLYESEVASELLLLEKRKGRELTYEEKAAFIKKVDHKRYSAVNTELMDKILSAFDSAL